MTRVFDRALFVKLQANIYSIGYLSEHLASRLLPILICLAHRSDVSDHGIVLPKKQLPKNIFAYLFSVHNTISLSRHEQV